MNTYSTCRYTIIVSSHLGLTPIYIYIYIYIYYLRLVRDPVFMSIKISERSRHGDGLLLDGGEGARLASQLHAL